MQDCLEISFKMNPFLFGSIIIMIFWLITLIVLKRKKLERNIHEFWWASFACSLLRTRTTMKFSSKVRNTTTNTWNIQPPSLSSAFIQLHISSIFIQAKLLYLSSWRCLIQYPYRATVMAHSLPPRTWLAAIFDPKSVDPSLIVVSHAYVPGAND